MFQWAVLSPYTFLSSFWPYSLTPPTSRNSSFLSLPLSVLQLLLMVMALVGVAVMTLWTKVTPQLLAAYNVGEYRRRLLTCHVYVLVSAFVLFEYILTWDDVYPLSVSMTTGVIAVFTFWRYTVSCPSSNLSVQQCILKIVNSNKEWTSASQSSI